MNRSFWKLVMMFLILSIGNQYIVGQAFHGELEVVASENNLVGMSVVAVCGAKVVDVFHYGKADLVRDLDITDSTMYRIASISKTVAATALLKLLHDEGIDIGEGINDYLDFPVVNPNFPDDAITFQMILSHTSALQDGTGYSGFLSATYNQIPVPGIVELLQPGGAFYTSNMWRTEVPGSYFAYSNINFGLVGTLIEQISGERFDIYVRKEVLEPLDIKGSFNVRDLDDIDHVAVLYRNAIPQSDNYLGVYPPPFDTSSYTVGSNGVYFAPQGGLRISALDLAKFMIMHANAGTYNGVSVLDSVTISEMHAPIWTYNGTNGDNYYNLFNQWGLGIQSTTNASNGDIVIDGITMYGHPGEAYGLISDMYFEKEEQFGLIFITNGYFGTQNYTFGTNSAFYVPEEAVFDLVKAYHYDTCDPLSTNLVNPGKSGELFSYNPVEKTLILRDNQEGFEVTLYSQTGKVINQKRVGGQDWILPELPAGLYIIRATAGAESQLLRVYLPGF